MQLEDWLDDLCVRFIVNLPPEELESVERICFQVEEAQWFYEDFIRPRDPSLPSLSLRAFSLRIFQHCPLFSQWSAQHHTTAFAEFLAYKSRVPVRGAIMLNEAMDEVVLVKGWKKGANWSFPRGKINKDEDDLDCAVREVYEETGYDIRTAGLVKDEKDMKYIEVTMREQHMKLYVFRGVSKTAHFEPRTRKEISKIEWYKLTDLPTIKKHRHQESNDVEAPAVNANKFYMVAPFLNPLKKWIMQQKKKENRFSSQLSAPALIADETTADEYTDVNNVTVFEEPLQHPIPSDLPEVSKSKFNDPMFHLKEILNIGTPQPPTTISMPTPVHVSGADTAKSNALLALLRAGSTAELRAGPTTPFEHDSFPSDTGRPLQQSERKPTGPFNQFSASESQVQSEMSTFPGINQLPQTHQVSRLNPSFSPPFGLSQTSLTTLQRQNTKPQQIRAPYQQTGDPEFAQDQYLQSHTSSIPPASALPKLTNHTKALLDVFKGGVLQPGSGKSAQQAAANSGLLDLFKGNSEAPSRATAFPTVQQAKSTFLKHQVVSNQRENKAALAPPTSQTEAVSIPSHNGGSVTNSGFQTQLLGLLKKDAVPSTGPAVPQGTSKVVQPPVELAAHVPKEQDKDDGDGQKTKDELLLALLRQGNGDNQKKTTIKKQRAKNALREGETSATLSSPLNQPEFEAIPKTPKQNTNGMGRSPLTSHRTLYDPNQSSAIKILARPEETVRQGPSKSPQPNKIKTSTASPKRTARPASKEQPKPFQPQILRRPKTTEGQLASSPTLPPITTSTTTRQPSTVISSSPLSRNRPSESEPQIAVGESSRKDSHKQTLISLFNSPSTLIQNPTSGQYPSRVVSPLSASQVLSPATEVPVSAIEPISTRSRMGSLASLGSGVTSARPGLEKKQTGAENKSFLLGYLGRIASQDGG